MLTCREMARRIASDEVAGASIGRRLGVRMHLLMCTNCRRFAQQMRSLGAVARRSWGGEPEDPAAIGRLEEKILRKFPGARSGSIGAGDDNAPPGDEG